MKTTKVGYVFLLAAALLLATGHVALAGRNSASSTGDNLLDLLLCDQTGVPQGSKGGTKICGTLTLYYPKSYDPFLVDLFNCNLSCTEDPPQECENCILTEQCDCMITGLPHGTIRPMLIFFRASHGNDLYGFDGATLVNYPNVNDNGAKVKDFIREIVIPCIYDGCEATDTCPDFCLSSWKHVKEQEEGCGVGLTFTVIDICIAIAD